MQTHLDEWTVSTRGDNDVIDVSDGVQQVIDRAGMRDGLCTAFVAHSTCAMTTIEAEPGCIADLDRVLSSITPADDGYEHNVRNHDTNGHAHIRAALMGPSVTIPFASGRLCLGTWQRVVCVDFDDRPRSRRLVVQLLGM
jgi:secondary thiamine-phosphate synthase enzyme